jgi:hypothetical protein
VVLVFTFLLELVRAALIIADYVPTVPCVQHVRLDIIYQIGLVFRLVLMEPLEIKAFVNPVIPLAQYVLELLIVNVLFVHHHSYSKAHNVSIHVVVANSKMQIQILVIVAVNLAVLVQMLKHVQNVLLILFSLMDNAKHHANLVITLIAQVNANPAQLVAFHVLQVLFVDHVRMVTLSKHKPKRVLLDARVDNIQTKDSAQIVQVIVLYALTHQHVPLAQLDIILTILLVPKHAQMDHLLLQEFANLVTMLAPYVQEASPANALVVLHHSY